MEMLPPASQFQVSTVSSISQRGDEILTSTYMERPPQLSDHNILSMLVLFTDESMTNSMEMEDHSTLLFHASEFLEVPQLSLDNETSPATSMHVSQFSDDNILSMLNNFTEKSMTDCLEMEDDSALLFHASDFLEAPQFSLDEESSPATSLQVSRFSDYHISSMLDSFIENSTVYGQEMEDDSAFLFHASDFVEAPQFSLNCQSSPATSMQISQLSDDHISSMLDIFIQDSIGEEMEDFPIQFSAPFDKHDILCMLDNFI